MKPMFKSNKGISELVAYVLLISLTLSIAAIVYGWLTFYIEDNDVSCPKNVNVAIKDYECTRNVSGIPGTLTLTIENRGYFNVSGYFIRASDNPNSTFGTKELKVVEDNFAPSEERTEEFNNLNTYNLGNLTIVEVQPFRDEKKRILCEDYTVIQVNCTEVIA